MSLVTQEHSVLGRRMAAIFDRLNHQTAVLQRVERGINENGEAGI
jgi:hypothetical protein